jgi:hypothetical protein
MIISQSRVSLTSAHRESAAMARTESLRAWVDDPATGRRVSLDAQRAEAQVSEEVSAERREEASSRVSAEARRLAAEARARRDGLAAGARAQGAADAAAASSDGGCDACGDDLESFSGDTRTFLMKQIVERVFGEKIELWDRRAAEEARAEAAADGADREADAADSGDAAPAQERAGWGVAYDATLVRTEVEETSFSGRGVVRTADGREITFEVDLAMSRESVDVTRFRLVAGDAKLTDPIVINFSGTAADLTDALYDFDLNADGADERISFVRAGSGLLALDRNGDGLVNDGSELFGPTTGDGFGELAALDGDGNGWLDEADSAYGDLRVWSKDAAGADLLETLAAKSVGAIYLGSVATPFALESSSGETRGEIAETGVYLDESGAIGTIQHVDLVT